MVTPAISYTKTTTCTVPYLMLVAKHGTEILVLHNLGLYLVAKIEFKIAKVNIPIQKAKEDLVKAVRLE